MLCTSPRNSAYGPSLSTTTTTSACAIVDAGVVTLASACEIVVPWVCDASPCHVMVQPPHWFVRLLAPLPPTHTRLVLASGSTLPVFCKRTSDSRTARRPSARCSADPSAPSAAGSRFHVKSPASHLTAT